MKDVAGAGAKAFAQAARPGLDGCQLACEYTIHSRAAQSAHAMSQRRATTRSQLISSGHLDLSATGANRGPAGWLPKPP